MPNNNTRLTANSSGAMDSIIANTAVICASTWAAWKFTTETGSVYGGTSVKFAAPKDAKPLLLQGLQHFFGVKPPFVPTQGAGRKELVKIGNVFMHPYKDTPYTPLRMVGHVKKTEDVTAAGDAYATAVKAYMWDSRATVFAATRGSAPRTSDKLDELLAHASLFRDLPDAPDGSSSTGIEFDVFGWGDLVDSVVVVRTKKGPSPFRVGWATFGAVRAPAPSERAAAPQHNATAFWMHVFGEKFTDRVLWREDNSLNPLVRVRTDDEGNALWRYVAPSDLTVGSTYDVVLDNKFSLRVADKDGVVSQTLLAYAVYFTRSPPKTTSTNKWLALVPGVALQEEMEAHEHELYGVGEEETPAEEGAAKRKRVKEFSSKSEAKSDAAE